ncbi:unnamed protein product, partial [Fusarium fujikuroi]
YYNRPQYRQIPECCSGGSTRRMTSY